MLLYFRKLKVATKFAIPVDLDAEFLNKFEPVSSVTGVTLLAKRQYLEVITKMTSIRSIVWA